MDIKPFWYVQPLDDDNGTAHRISYLAREQGMEVISESYIPFGGMCQKWIDVTYKLVNQPLVFLGSINAMKNCQGNTFINRYLADWADWKALRCSTYYAKWGKYLLAEKYGFYPLAEVRRFTKLPTDFLGFQMWYGDKDGRVFVRPDSNDKVFCGGVVSPKNMGGWLAMADKDRLEDTLLCVVARPEEIHAEYRLVIADGKVISSSRYRLKDCIDYREGCPPGAKLLAEEASKVWSPHRIFVMDVAQTICGGHVSNRGGRVGRPERTYVNRSFPTQRWEWLHPECNRPVVDDFRNATWPLAGSTPDGNF